MINFRSIADTGVVQLGPVNVLTGRNNAGKSAILRAMYMAQSGPTFIADRDVRFEATEATVRLWLDDRRPRPDVGLETLPADGYLEVTMSPSHDAATRYIFNKGQGANSIDRLPANRETGLFVPVFTRRKASSYSFQVSPALANTVGETDYHLTARIAALTSGDHDGAARYRELMQRVLGVQVRPVLMGDGQQPGIGLSASRAIAIDRMGEGVSSALALIAELADANNRVFLLEEPENDLHPAALRALLEVIVEASEANQFVVTTHSDLVLRVLGAVDGSRVLGVTLNTAAPIPSTEVSAIATQRQRLEILSELGYEPEMPTGWLVMEESTAELIVREVLIPWFVPSLAALRTVAAGGTGDVPRKFNDLVNFVLYAQLSEKYSHRTWVLVDGDESGVKVVADLRSRFTGWNPGHFEHFAEVAFEAYYPPRFAAEVEAIASSGDKRRRQELKGQLAETVRAWAFNDPSTARSELAESAVDVIRKLQQIAEDLQVAVGSAT